MKLGVASMQALFWEQMQHLDAASRGLLGADEKCLTLVSLLPFRT